MQAKNIFVISWFLSLALIIGCSSLERRGRTEPPARVEGAFDEQPGESADRPKMGEPLQEIKGPPNFGVVLGPGGLKALAHAGVMKELIRARVPIKVIVGLEWGALPAGLFSLRGEANDIEWQIYKLEQKGWPRSGWLNSRPGAVSTNAFKDYFSEAFGQNSLSSGKIKFACPARRLSSGRVTWYRSGGFAQALAACVRFPPLNKLEPRDGVVAAPGALAEAAALAREMGAEKLIYVNVLSQGVADLDAIVDAAAEDAGLQRIIWAQIGEAIHHGRQLYDEWVEVNTKNINVFSLDQRKELQSRGEAAGKVAVKNLTSKYGL